VNRWIAEALAARFELVRDIEQCHGRIMKSADARAKKTRGADEFHGPVRKNAGTRRPGTRKKKTRRARAAG
jgi:hypothetical protein